MGIKKKNKIKKEWYDRKNERKNLGQKKMIDF